MLANQQITQPGGSSSQTIAFLLDNGPSAAVLPATPANGLLPSPGYAVTSKSRPTTLLLPTIDAWNLSVERQVTSTVTLTVAYVGNKGTHTLSAGDGNTTNPNEAAIFLPAQYSVTGNALHYDPSVKPTDVSGVAAGSAAAGVGISGIAANGGTANTNYLRRYYGGKLAACSDPNYAKPAGVPAGSCGWQNDVSYYGDNQNTHYNALQVGVAKIFTHGLSFNANYAWQRAFNYASGYATWNKRAGYGRDDSIREQQITIYGIYDLPFGKNRQFLSNGNRLVQELVGGFQISPIITYATGLPFTLSYTSHAAQIPDSAPAYVNGNPKALKTGVRGVPGVGSGVSFYSPQILGGAFSVPALDMIGNTGRNSVYGPHFFNADLAIQKDFPITERFVAQLRMDAYNAFNHINLGNPGSNIQNNGSITSGAGVSGSANPRQLQFSGRLQF